jgi:hypothetical protein
MRAIPTHHRCPRAGIDPVDDPTTALAIIGLAMHRPRRAETIVVLLDAERRGVGIVVVAGTLEADAAVEIVEFLAGSAAAGGRVAAFVVASVRRPAADGGGCGRSDADRWLEMSDVAEAAGVELLEWFVVDDAISCPRDLLGEPPRW